MLTAFVEAFGKIDGIYSKGYASVRSLQLAIHAAPEHASTAVAVLGRARAARWLAEKPLTPEELELLRRSGKDADLSETARALSRYGRYEGSHRRGGRRKGRLPHADLVDKDGAQQWSRQGWLDPSVVLRLRAAWDSLRTEGTPSRPPGLDEFKILNGAPFSGDQLKQQLQRNLTTFPATLLSVPGSRADLDRFALDMQIEVEGKAMPFPALPGVILEHKTPDSNSGVVLFVWKGAKGISWSRSPSGGTLTMNGRLGVHPGDLRAHVAEQPAGRGDHRG